MLAPAEFVNVHLRKLDEYIRYVTSTGSTVGKYERLSVERFLALKKKYQYKEDQVVRVLKFFSLLNLPNKNEVSQIQLLPFQVFWLANLYGLYINDTDRLIDEAYIEIAKKNGKTSFFAGLSIYEAIGDNELNANCLLVASSREQARVALQYINNIIENSPAIEDFFQLNKNLIFNKTENTLNKIEVRASDAAKIQGLNTSFSLIDEFAFHKNSELKDKIKSGMIARKNHLQVAITTAANNRQSPAYALRQTAGNVLDGLIQLDSLFIQIFCLDEKEELDNPSMWSKANPALNYIFDLDQLLKEYNSAKLQPEKLNTFYTDNLNLWIDNLTKRWIADDLIKSLMQSGTVIPDGAEVYLGYDGSATRDLTAISILWYNPVLVEFVTKIIYVFPDNESRKIREGSIDLSVWLQQGYILQNPLPVIDDDFIIEIFRSLKEKYKIHSVGYDAFNSRGLFQKIERELDIQTDIVSQKITSLNYPIRFLESMVYKKKIWFEQNPVTRWNFQNIVTYYDSNKNIKLVKNKGEAIDGVIATVCAIYQWLYYNESSTSYLLTDLKTLYGANK